jgi:phytoene dehydrogenase-like protein
MFPHYFPLLASAAEATNVVVVGGGFAGLGVATKLHSAGLNVTLLEARDQLGGRAFTDSTAFEGMSIDMGAMWIHGVRNNPVHELAVRYGIETQVTDYENQQYFDANGSLVNTDAVDDL